MTLDNKQINELVSSASEDWTESSGSESDLDAETILLAELSDCSSSDIMQAISQRRDRTVFAKQSQPEKRFEKLPDEKPKYSEEELN